MSVGDEKIVLSGFWPKIRRVASHVPFAQDAVAAFYCATDPQTPRSAKAIIFGALAYFVMPADAVPDFLPLIGFTDDAAALAAAIGAISSHLRERHYQAARAWLAGNALRRADQGTADSSAS